jgi:RNA polymerase primary sigma factor
VRNDSGYTFEIVERLEEDLPKKVSGALAEEGEEGRIEALPPENDDGVKQYLATIGRYPLLSLEEEIALARKVREGQEAAKKLFQVTGIEAATILRVARARALEEPLAPGLPAPSAEEQEKVEALCRFTKEARRLYLLVREGEIARKELVLANLRLVVSTVKPIARKRNLDIWDAIAEGNRGLLRATETFDERLGYKFSTYATHWIRQHVLRYAQQVGRFIRLPVHKEETLGKLEKARIRLTQELGRSPSPEEIAGEMGEGWTPEKVEELFEMAPEVYRLEEPVSFGDGETGDLYGDFLQSPLPNPEEVALDRVRREAILETLVHLPPREAEVLRLRYGLDGTPPLSLGEIAKRFKITRGRVRQLEKKAISRLQRNSHVQKRLKGFED